MEQNKLFHPTIQESLTRIAASREQLSDHSLEVAAFMIHHVGWLAQQGFTEEKSTGVIAEMLRMDRGAVIKACAAGLAEMYRIGKEE